MPHIFNLLHLFICNCFFFRGLSGMIPEVPLMPNSLYEVNYICIYHYLGSRIKFTYIFVVRFVTNYAVCLHI